MGFGQAVATGFRKYADFGSRARRAEYWYFTLFALLATIPAHFLDQVLSPKQDSGPASAILSLVLFLPSLAVTVRRLHDSNRSGWWIGGFFVYLVGALMISFMVVFGPAGTGTKGPMGEIVPAVLTIGIAVYAVWMIVLMALKGTRGANRYGADPLAPA